MSKKRLRQRVKELEKLVEALIERVDEHHAVLYGHDEIELFGDVPKPPTTPDRKMN